MSDKDDLFADSDSDDTNDLIEESNKASPPKRLQKKKKAAPKKKIAKKAAARERPTDDSDLSDSDVGGGGGGGGDLFDSDDSDNEGGKTKKKGPAKKAMSKRERLEALAKRNRQEDDPKQSGASSTGVGGASNERKKESGYDSGDSYDSADFQRTKEDDDFLDTTGEDADAVNELYAEQHFDDDRPDRDEPKKKKRKYHDGPGGGGGSGDRVHVGDQEPDNPIMAAVYRMKKKKREKKGLTEIEEECKAFLSAMELAAEQDEQAVAEKRPATKKLSMLSQVLEMLTKRDLQRHLLELDLLAVVRQWVQPLKNGKLGNVTVRQRVLEAIASMNGENSVRPDDLKKSGLGKTVMVLFKHRDETPAMKRQLKALIEQWSRPIFNKSGDMRDLVRFQASRGESGLAALSRQRAMAAGNGADAAMTGGLRGPANDSDLQSLIKTGKKGSAESGGASSNRVRVPFSKGFAFTVRPEKRTAGTPEDAKRGSRGKADPAGGRGKLSKRMLEKSRAVSKNQRSANISIEGRRTK